MAIADSLSGLSKGSAAFSIRMSSRLPMPPSNSLCFFQSSPNIRLFHLVLYPWCGQYRKIHISIFQPNIPRRSQPV